MPTKPGRFSIARTTAAYSARLAKHKRHRRVHQSHRIRKNGWRCARISRPNITRRKPARPHPSNSSAHSLAVAMSIGAVFAAMNTMYAAVGARTREIGTLRVLGFRRRVILASFNLEGAISRWNRGSDRLLAGVADAMDLPRIRSSFRHVELRHLQRGDFSIPHHRPALVLEGMIFAIIVGNHRQFSSLPFAPGPAADHCGIKKRFSRGANHDKNLNPTLETRFSLSWGEGRGEGGYKTPISFFLVSSPTRPTRAKPASAASVTGIPKRAKVAKGNVHAPCPAPV